MSRHCSFIARIRKDQTGSTLVEFAMLAPVFLAMVFGLFQTAVLIQNYNALNSAGADLSRFVVVEYQKGSTLSESQIQTAAVGIVSSKPYFLKSQRLDVSSSTSASDMPGADKIAIHLAYQTGDFLQFFGVNGITMTFNKNLYVPHA
ncbi:MAG: pilus assembly protein [Sphingomonadales bacterium]|nr:pilus assembly protein [Sphingomonadales bacterium]MDE2570222.1 pilus assembly protein [Sphingomonadales bacterium]